MRFLFGVIIGVLITVGYAWVHDSSATTDMTGQVGENARMVNWDVVNRNVNDLSETVRVGWDRLTHSVRRAEG